MTSKAFGLAQLGNVYDDGALSNRNLIINGAMQVAQRGASIACGSSSLTYSLDRFAGRPNSSTNTTIAQVTDAPTGFQYSARVTRNSGQTGSLTRLQTGLETSNMVSLRGQKVTISFYAKAGSGYTPSSNALTVNIYEGDGTERIRAISAYDNENVLLQETATLTTSWQRFEYSSSSTAATDLSQLTVEFQAAWSGTASSNDEYYITGVQLEVGDTATPFEHRSYGDELARCQRYYYQINKDNSRSYQPYAVGQSSNSTTAWFIMEFPTTMRANPTMIITNPTNFLVNGAVTTAVTADIASEEKMMFYAYVSSGLTTGGGVRLYQNNSSSTALEFSAEL